MSNTVSCEGNSVNNKNDCRAKHDKFEYSSPKTILYNRNVHVFRAKDKSTACVAWTEGQCFFVLRTQNIQIHNPYAGFPLAIFFARTEFFLCFCPIEEQTTHDDLQKIVIFVVYLISYLDGVKWGKTTQKQLTCT